MSEVKLDTNDPGKAANVAARAAILYARVSGYNAENSMHHEQGHAIAYASDAFETAIEECFPELRGEG